MSSDCHIKFDGVDGESTHKDHKGEIDVLSWDWGVSSTSQAIGAGPGASRGKSVAGPFVFLHVYDRASPVLAKQCAAGKLFKDATFTATKAGEGQKVFLKIIMKDVLVTSVQASYSADGNIAESVSLTYRDIEFVYKPQDDKGALGAEVKFGWDVAKSTVR